MLNSNPVAFISFYSEFTRYPRQQKNNILLFVLQGEEREPGAVNYIVDDLLVGQVAAKTLKDAGCKQAGVFSWPPDNHCAAERYKGFSEECKKLKLKFTNFPLNNRPVKDALSSKIFSCDGVFFFSDFHAIEGMRDLQRIGIRIPQDVKIVGADNHFFASYMYPSLTTMDLNEGIIADKLKEDILRILKGETLHPSTTRIPVNLISRESA